MCSESCGDWHGTCPATIADNRSWIVASRIWAFTHLVTQTPIETHLIPETYSDGPAYYYEEYGPIYASDTNGQVDSNGVQRDFRIIVFTDASSTSGLTGTRAFVIGQLFDEP